MKGSSLQKIAWISVLLGAAALGVIPAGAETPEPMPAYAIAAQLREDASLHAVAFSQTIGIACGDRGAILRSEDGGQSWNPVESGVECPLADVIWISPQRVVVVGGGYDRITRISRGAVLYSNDAGQHWQRAADEELPKFKSVRIREDTSLIATCDWSHSLLTYQLESHDGGRTWKGGGRSESRAINVIRPPTSSELNRWVSATGLPARVRDACRINDSQFCAVGDHGVILLSVDKGKSWRAVRGENRQTGILFVATHPASVPWSQLGNEALENRNRISLLLHTGADPDGDWATDDQDLPRELAAQIAVMLGGSGADMIAASDSSLTRTAMEWLSIHRPAAVVMDQSLPSEMRDAFRQAATATGVQRVVVYSFDGSGHTSLHRDALLPKSGVLASDLLADAMHYLAPNRRGNSSVSLRYLYDVAPAARRGDSVLGGVPLTTGQRLAVPIRQASRRQLQIVQARLKQTELTANLIRTSRTPHQFAESLRSTLDQTAKDDRFRLAWSILLETTPKPGNGFREVVLEELAERFPATSAGRWAGLRRESIRHSTEWQRLRSSLDDTRLMTASVPTAETVQVSPFQDQNQNRQSSVQQVSSLSPVVVPKPEVQKFAPQVNEQVEVDLTWEFHPLVLISREAARNRGDDGQLQVASGESPNLKRLASANSSSWSALLSTSGRQVIVARRAAAPPKLDGTLDDECWQSALSLAGRQSRLRVAYDDDYIYIAVICHGDQLHPDSFADLQRGIIRDHDLASIDRLQISIDTDRDFMTAMQLSVSDAGRTHDAIDGNPQWHPTWYVDATRENDQVTFEMAILRRDMVDLPITAGESWFVLAKPIRAGSENQETLVPKPRQWMRVIFRP